MTVSKEVILEQLQSSNVYQRRYAAGELSRVHESSIEIVAALRKAAQSDSDELVKKIALESLQAEPHQAIMNLADFEEQAAKLANEDKPAKEQSRKRRRLEKSRLFPYPASVCMDALPAVFKSLKIEMISGDEPGIIGTWAELDGQVEFALDAICDASESGQTVLHLIYRPDLVPAAKRSVGEYRELVTDQMENIFAELEHYLAVIDSPSTGKDDELRPELANHLLEDLLPGGIDLIRQRAAEKLSNLAESSPEIVEALAFTKMNDKNEEVKQAADEALNSPANQALISQDKALLEGPKPDIHEYLHSIFADKRKASELYEFELSGIDPVKFKEWQQAYQAATVKWERYFTIILMVNALLLLVGIGILSGPLSYFITRRLVYKEANSLLEDVGIKPGEVERLRRIYVECPECGQKNPPQLWGCGECRSLLRPDN